MELNDLKRLADFPLEYPPDYLMAYLKQHLVNRGKSKEKLIKGFINEILQEQSDIYERIKDLPYKSYGLFAKTPDKEDPEQIVYFFLLPMDIEWENFELVLPIRDTLYIMAVFMELLISKEGRKDALPRYLQFLETCPITEGSQTGMDLDVNWRLSEYSHLFGPELYETFIGELDAAFLLEVESMHILPWLNYLLSEGAMSLEELAHKVTYPTITDKEAWKKVMVKGELIIIPIEKLCRFIAHCVSRHYLAISKSNSHLYLLSLEYADKVGLNLDDLFTFGK